MLKWGMVLLAMAMPATLHAEEIPQFDIRIYCASTAVPNCLSDETRRLNLLSERWSSYPEQRKHFCVQSVRFMRDDRRSYGRLAVCLNDPVIS